MKPRIIAFYLPQFYPTPENDEWWGKGFTEWTNVGRAKPLFKGHYQPRVPADLGYYDLRLPEVRGQQAKLAREAGIEGFCYWHYWFAGKRMLDRVFQEVLDSGSPDYPFCLCWANHSWYQKTWDPNKPNKLLIEQTYPGVEDYEAHFYAMLPAFKDKRYIKVKDKLLFGLFAPLDLPEPEIFFKTWNRLAKENGLPEFLFWGYNPSPKYTDKIIEKGVSFVVEDFYGDAIASKDRLYMRLLKYLSKKLSWLPLITTYSHYVNYVVDHLSEDSNVLPCVLPNYDHTPRSGRRGLLLHNSTPALWGNLLRKVFLKRQNICNEENIIFIKAWNEWGEGNYLEPDLKFGTKYLEKIKEILSIPL